MTKLEELGCDEVILPMAVFDQHKTAQLYVEHLQARIAELEAENRGLLEVNRDCVAHFNELKADYDAERQQNALLTLQAQKYREFLESAPLGSGVCCCGGPMDHSQWGEGHTPVDSGEYAVAQLLSTPLDPSALDVYVAEKVKPWKKDAERYKARRRMAMESHFRLCLRGGLSEDEFIDSYDRGTDAAIAAQEPKA